MTDELTPDDLIRGWEVQDHFSDMAQRMLDAGIELGVKSAGIEITRIHIEKNYEPLETEDIKKAMDTAYTRASEELRRRLKNVREPGTEEE